MPVEVTGMTPLIQVFNMPRALAFYRGILGYRVVADSGDGDKSSWVSLRLNDTNLMLNDQYEPGHEPSAPPQKGQAGTETHVFTLTVPIPMSHMSS